MTPEELITQSLAKLRTAKRFSGSSASYKKDNPTEYAKVIAYLDGGARPSGVTTDMGLHAMGDEDARRALVVVPPPPPPPPPPAQGAFGVPWNASGLGNLEIGKTNRQVAQRFKAAYTGKILSNRAFLKQGSGYSAGDGGDPRCDLYAADANGKPTGSSLGGSVVSNPLTSQFWTYALNAQVTKDNRYCLVFSNASSGQASNYVSLNNMNIPSGNPRQPEVPDADLAVFYRDGTGGWNSDHSNYTPIFDLTYEDGSTQGIQYIDFMPSQRQNLPVTETLTPTQTRSFTTVHAYVGGSGTITAKLAGQTAIKSVSAGWAVVPLAVALQSGQTYPLKLSGSGLTMFPYQKGTGYGFHDPFPEGRGSQADRDWPVYLT